MKSVFNDVEALDLVIHNLNKVDSKLNAGRFYDARRELLRVISALSQNKKDLMKYIEELASKGAEGEEQNEE